MKTSLDIDLLFKEAAGRVAGRVQSHLSLSLGIVSFPDRPSINRLFILSNARPARASCSPR